jgi:hypothetical protein
MNDAVACQIQAKSAAMGLEKAPVVVPDVPDDCPLVPPDVLPLVPLD